MHKTQFAGLTAPDPNDAPLTVDGGSFATRNPDITDHFLRIGAVAHRHDEHVSLADPVVAASAAVVASGGTIPSGRALYVGYTLLDNYGGETLLSPVVSVSTPDALTAPLDPLAAVYEAGVGDMVVGTFYYAVTLVDADGGETMLGPTARIERPPGNPNGRINLTGLAAGVGLDAADHWRLWRSDNGGRFNIIATGTANTFTDDGINPTDLAASPPSSSSATHATNSLTVTLPTPLPGGSSGLALYISDDGSFSNPSLWAAYPLASAGASLTIRNLEVQTGAPPDVSTSIPGAHKITLEELADGVAGGLGGGGGGSGPLQLIDPWFMRPPEAPGIPTAGQAIWWQAGTARKMALYGMWNPGDDAYTVEIYSGQWDAALWTGDTTHFHLDAANKVTLVDAGDWRIRPVTNFATGNWGEAQNGGYVEFDYTIVNGGWTTISADIQSLNAMPAGVRAVINRAAGTFSLVSIADGSVIASVGAADGYSVPAVGQSGRIVVAVHNDRVTAFDARGAATGPAFFDVTLDGTISAAVNQWMGALGINATDPAAIVVDYNSMSRNNLLRELRVGALDASGGSFVTEAVVFGERGGGVAPPEWRYLFDSGAAAPQPLANGWTIVNPVAFSTDYLAFRYNEATRQLQLRGKIDGSAATGAVFATLPAITGLSIPGDLEAQVIHIAADETRTPAFIRLSTSRDFSLIPAGLTPLTGLLFIDVTFDLGN